MDILMILLQLFSGTVSGFITNKFAVKWLFRPVTVFGHRIFDVSLLSTDEKQERFINSIAECVEHHILTYDVLEPEICSPKMREHIEQIINDIFENSLKSAVNMRRISELDGFADFKRDIMNEADPIIAEIMPELIKLISRNVRISDIVSQKQISFIIQKLSQLIDEEDFENTEKLACDFVCDTIDNTDIAALADDVFKHIDIDSMDIDSEIIAGIIKSYANKLSFEKLLEINIERFLDLLSRVDMTVYDAFSPEFCAKLDDTVCKLVPKAVPVIVRFIETNRKEIESLVNDAVKKTHGLGAAMMIQGIFKLIDVPQKLINAVKDLQSGNSGKISAQIIGFLNTSTVSDITKKLRPHITAKKLSGIAVKLINKYGSRAAVHITKIAKKNIVSLINGYIKNNENKIKAKLKRLVNERLDTKAVLSAINKHSEESAEFISKKLNSFMLDEEQIKSILKDIFGYVFERYENRKISAIVRMIKQNTNVKSKLTDKVYDTVEDNLSLWLNGNTKKMVAASLGRLDTEQLLDIAMKLMSDELKYLSYLGALLGFCVTGIVMCICGTAHIPQLTNALGFANGTLMGAVNFVLMAFIGIITNVVAIGMLFRPYKQKKILARNKYLKLLSHGLILQNQPRFAELMGNYINDELLTPETISAIIAKNKKTLSDLIIKFSVPFTSKYINENKVSLSGTVKNKIMSAVDGAADMLSAMRLRIFKGKLNPQIIADKYSGRNVLDVIPESVIKEAADTVVRKEIPSLKIGEDMLAAAVRQAEKVIGELSSRSVKNYTSKFLGNYVFTSTGNVQTAGDMFNASIKRYINESLDDLSEYCCKFLIRRTASKIDNLADSSNFMISLGLRAIGDTLNYLKTVSVPMFITSKTEDIKNIIKNFIENTVYTMDKDSIGSIISNINLDADSLISKYDLRGFLKETAESVIMSFNGTELLDYITITDFRKLKSEFDKNADMKDLAEIIMKHVKMIIPDLSDLSNEIDKFAEKHKNMYIGTIIDKSELEQQINTLTDKLKREGLEAELEHAVCEILTRESDLHIINDDFRVDILSFAAESIYQSVGRYSAAVISDIDFYGITKNKIDSLKPKEIEMLIRSFANDAFHKLYWLGVFGGAFGINSYFSIAVMLVDWITEKYNSKA